MTRSAWLLFAALSVVWGVPYFFIKIALVDFSPAVIAFGRVALAAAIVAALVPRVQWRAIRTRVPAIAAVAVTDVALPFYCISNGERYVSSSLTGLLLAAIPIVVALLALLLDRRDRPTRWQAAGIAVGVGGVAALLGFDIGHDRHVSTGVALVGAAAVSYSIGLLMIKHWFDGLPAQATIAAMLGIAAVLLAPAALLDPPRHMPGIPATFAVLVLGAVCTAIAYVMDLALIAQAGATRASIVTYVNPAVAVALGVVVLRESLGPAALAGLVLIVAGSWLSTGGRPPSEPEAPAPAAVSG